MLAEGARIKKERAEENRRNTYQSRVREIFEKHPTEYIINLWIQFEASEFCLDEVDGFCIYDIMAALNQRGEGELCRY
jgi:hypothetical protein